MKLIVGLGNPGLKYKKTRHNTGFMAIDAYIKENNYKLKEEPKFQGKVYQGNDFILLEPSTFMNLSGTSVSAIVNYFKIDTKDVLIVLDDFNLPFGHIRIREKGSAGGHKGLKSIISCLQTEEFNRLRVGLGEPKNNTCDFVLSKLSKEDQTAFDNLFKTTSEIIDNFIKSVPVDEIMNKYNTRKE